MESPSNETAPKKQENDESETFSCDRRISLYILNQTFFLEDIKHNPVVYKNNGGSCHPAYWAAYVPKTNLLLVVVERHSDEGYDTDCQMPPTTEPVPTDASITSREPCHKVDLGLLPRRPLEGCYTYHDKVLLY